MLNPTTILKSDAQGTAEHRLSALELRERHIWIDTDIDEALVNKAIRELNYLNSLNAAPIKLFITTNGGSIEDGLALYDAIAESPAPVYVCVVARAYSMGAILLQAGAKRYALTHSRIMIHRGRKGQEIGTSSDYKDSLKMLDYYDDIVCKIIAEKTDKDVDEIQKEIQYDHYFTAEEAKDFNLIDDIITLDAFINLA